MHKKKILVYFILLFSCVVHNLYCSTENGLLIFGDSLSDTGTGYALSESLGLPPIPPASFYYQGRYSNGPNWADYTVQALAIPMQNFAVGGAQTGSENVLQNFGYKMGGLFQQIERYEAKYSSIPSATTVVVEIGANNFFSLLLTPVKPSREEVKAKIEQAMKDLQQALTHIQRLGAKKIIVWNLPDLGKMAEFRSGSPLSQIAPLMTEASVGFNTALLNLVKEKNKASCGAHILYYDLFTFYNKIFHQAESSGVDVRAYALYAIFCNPPIIKPTEVSISNILFYDQMHPTTEVCKKCSEDFVAFINQCLPANALQVVAQN
jgi:phospholipase/lecithinase/hemolysin